MLCWAIVNCINKQATTSRYEFDWKLNKCILYFRLGIDIDNLSDLDSDDDQEGTSDSNTDKDDHVQSDSVKDSGDSDVPDGNDNIDSDSKNSFPDKSCEQNKNQNSSQNSAELQQSKVNSSSTCSSSDTERETTQKHGLLTALEKLPEEPENTSDTKTEIVSTLFIYDGMHIKSNDVLRRYVVTYSLW